MRQHLVAGVRALWHRPWLTNGAQAGPGPAAGPTLTAVGRPGWGWDRSCWAAPRGREQVSLVGCPGEPQRASRPLPQLALPKSHLPAHLTRLGHRRSLSSVSRRAIAYSLTSSDTPTI